MKDFIARRVIGIGGENACGLRVLDSAIVQLHTYYAAVESAGAGDKERAVWAVVVMLDFGRTRADPHDFGWKAMDETAGPYQINCPERILRLLTPSDHPEAIAWRQRCRETLASRAARPVVIPGMLLSLHGRTFRVVARLRRGWRVAEGDDDYFFSAAQVRAAVPIQNTAPQAAAPPVPEDQLRLF